jgi:hypothetical protein
MIEIDSKKEYDLNNSMTAAQNIQLGTFLKEVKTNTSSSTGHIISGSSQFGDSINYTKFEADGTMVMAGSATVWTDLFFPLTTAKQGQTDKPPFSTTEVAYLFPQADTSHVMYIIAQFPHEWATGTDVHPHVHWKQTNSGSVVFKMEYKWFDIGGSVPTDFSTVVLDQDIVPYISGSVHQLTGGSGVISGSHISNVSSIMLIKLYRDDNTYSGAAVTYQFDIHICKDSLGSREIYIK